MGSQWVNSFKVATGVSPDQSAALADLREEAPELASVLGGTRKPDGNWEVPPMTVMVFVEGDRLKFCLSSQTHARVAFGCVADPAKIVSSIEDALVKGAFEWKPRKGGGRY